jgi:flagellar basal body-associated protein FliL
MKKILIILVVLLLLGGGGGAAWWFYFRKDPNAPPPPPPTPQLTQLSIPIRPDDSLTISVIKDGKVTKHFFFRFALIFDDPKNRDKANLILPALTNDFVVELSQLLTRKLVEDSNYDPNIIQAQLQKVCDRRLGKGVVTEVSVANIEQAE